MKIRTIVHRVCLFIILATIPAAPLAYTPISQAVILHTPVLQGNGLLQGITAIDAGSHTCALTTAGGVKCWGYNLMGQVGDGTTVARLTPVDVVGLGSGVSAVTSGASHTCALTTAGGVKCWGDNDNGQIGDGTTVERHTPVDVAGLGSGVSAIAGGDSHTCALTTGGGVKCWGFNLWGQVGDSTTVKRYTPVDVVGLGSGVSAIAGGASHTCALTTGGGVKCWGHNYYGQIGDGTTVEKHTPVNVVGLGNGVTAIAGGDYHTCALTTGGGIKCWGDNDNGQIGDGTTVARLTPVNVVGLGSGVSAIAGGFDQSCALTTAGGVKCWGDNDYGQIGDGTTVARLTPVNVVGLGSGVSAITTEGLNTCALTTGGGVKCWGFNVWGQVGDGTTVVRLAPVDVVAGNPVSQKLPIILVPGTGASFNYLCMIPHNLPCLIDNDYNFGWTWMPIAAGYYQPFIDKLEQTQYNDSNGYFNIFFYDWRKPINENGEILGHRIAKILARTGAPAVNLVGHSMGTLVIRAYVQDDNIYKNNVNAVALVGAPNHGAPKVYPYWEAGKVYQIWDYEAVDVGINLLLNPVYVTPLLPRAFVFRKMFPSFQQMLPTYDYLRDQSGVPILESRMTWRNEFLPPLNDTVGTKLNSRVKVKNIVGNQLKTAQQFFVKPPSIQNDLSQEWKDGEPIWDVDSMYSNEGDNTIPLKSAQMAELPEANVDEVKHTDLFTSIKVQKEIFDAFGIPFPSQVVASSTVAEPEVFLFVPISGTVSATITDATGHTISQVANEIAGAQYFREDGHPQQLVIIPNAQGQYTISLNSISQSQESYAVGIFGTGLVSNTSTIPVDISDVVKVISDTLPVDTEVTFFTDGTQLSTIPLATPTPDPNMHNKIFLPLVKR